MSRWPEHTMETPLKGDSEAVFCVCGPTRHLLCHPCRSLQGSQCSQFPPPRGPISPKSCCTFPKHVAAASLQARSFLHHGSRATWWFPWLGLESPLGECYRLNCVLRKDMLKPQVLALWSMILFPNRIFFLFNCHLQFYPSLKGWWSAFQGCPTHWHETARLSSQ